MTRSAFVYRKSGEVDKQELLGGVCWSVLAVDIRNYPFHIQAGVSKFVEVIHGCAKVGSIRSGMMNKAVNRVKLWRITYVFKSDVDIDPDMGDMDIIKFLMKEFSGCLQTVVVGLDPDISRECVLGRYVTQRTDVIMLDAELFTEKDVDFLA